MQNSNKNIINNKYIFLSFIIIIISICYCSFSNSINNYAYSNKLNFNRFKETPILHDGRIKPLDTYSRMVLKSIAGKDTINKQSAIEWLMELIINPTESYSKKVFYIHNPDLKYTLGLTNKNSRYYSFKEILPGIKKNISLISKLENNKEDKSLIFSPAEKQLLDLYHKSLLYFDLSRSVSFLLPEFNQDELANILKNDALLTIQNHKKKVNYWQLLSHKQKLISTINNTLVKEDKTSIQDQTTLVIAKKIKDLEQDKINMSLKVIPVENSLVFNQTKNLGSQNWLAPWEVANTNIQAKQYTQYVNIWQEIVYSYYNDNYINMQLNIDNLNKYTITNLEQYLNSNTNLKPVLSAEIQYNKLNLFNKAIIFYTLSFVVTLFLIFKTHAHKLKEKIFKPIALYSFTTAVICHFIGIAQRIFILQRPPVSNLYESILFVGFIIGLFSLIIEIYKRDSIAIFTGSLICTALQFVANSYAASGDTLGVLIAVLDNNFWLGTHVIAITSGYASCLVLSALAHAYLLKSVFKPKDPNTLIKYELSLSNLSKYILFMGLISLCLTLLGTILGGIWADQSWGRFWGWDPKENGALLICLWLTAILHGRISGQLNTFAFNTCAALTSITVMLAWFGVNVLGTGLHSYGFTENIALNLVLFILLELFLVIGLFIIYKIQQRHSRTLLKY